MVAARNVVVYGLHHFGKCASRRQGSAQASAGRASTGWLTFDREAWARPPRDAWPQVPILFLPGRLERRGQGKALQTLDYRRMEGASCLRSVKGIVTLLSLFEKGSFPKWTGRG